MVGQLTSIYGWDNLFLLFVIMRLLGGGNLWHALKVGHPVQSIG